MLIGKADQFLGFGCLEVQVLPCRLIKINEINKELQNQAWATLPQEFKKEVREEYENALKEYDGSHDWSYTTIDLLERIFGKHNLTEE